MAEITSSGYVGKTQNEYFQEEQQLYLDIDPKWNLDPSTPDGIKTASDSELYGNLDETGQLAYSSKDPAQATGLQLDIVCSITGTTRSLGTASTVGLELTGTNGTLVPQGSTVESDTTGLQWTTDNPVTLLGPSTPVAVNATCTELGSNSASIGTITTIVSPVGGWQTVTNPAVAVLGDDEQKDSSLRLERAAAVARPGSNQVDNMTGELFAVEGVTDVRIYENFTNAPDGNGIPGKSLAIYVIGGANGDVGRAIYIKKNPGVDMWSDPGATSVTIPVTSPTYSWNTQNITFNRPANVAINVVVDITDDGTLPVDASTIITTNILAYAAGGEPAEECGFNSTGFEIAEDVFVSRLYTPVNQVIGSYGNSYITNLTVNGGSSVAIAFNEISQWLDANITVNIT